MPRGRPRKDYPEDYTGDSGGDDGRIAEIGVGTITTEPTASRRSKATPRAVRTPQQVDILVNVVLEGGTYVASLGMHNPAVRMSEQERDSVATPIVNILLKSPFAAQVRRLAETSADGAALLTALGVYVTRVVMDTQVENAQKELAA